MILTNLGREFVNLAGRWINSYVHGWTIFAQPRTSPVHMGQPPVHMGQSPVHIGQPPVHMVKYLCNIFRSDCDYHHHIRLEVDRDAVFESAMQRLGRFNGSKLRNSQLDVTFKNEAGTLFSWGGFTNCTGNQTLRNYCKHKVVYGIYMYHKNVTRHSL